MIFRVPRGHQNLEVALRRLSLAESRGLAKGRERVTEVVELRFGAYFTWRKEVFEPRCSIFLIRWCGDRSIIQKCTNTLCTFVHEWKPLKNTSWLKAENSIFCFVYDSVSFILNSRSVLSIYKCFRRIMVQIRKRSNDIGNWQILSE